MAYSGTNFSILSMEHLSPASESSVTFIPARNLSAAISKVLAPISDSVNASNPDWINVASTYSIMYGLGWGLRLYKDLYPNDEGPPLEILYNFMAIPFQFATTAIHYGLGDDHLPDDMRTNATIATVYYRAIADPWVLYLYTAVALFMSAWCIVVLFVACLLAKATPKSSKFPEVDLITEHIGGNKKHKVNGVESVVLSNVNDGVTVIKLGQLRREKDNKDWGSQLKAYFTGGTVVKMIEGRRVLFKNSEETPEEGTLMKYKDEAG